MPNSQIMQADTVQKITRWMVCTIFAFIVLVYAFTRPLRDFVEYWTAAHLVVTHQNPYSIPSMLELQRAVGWKEELPLIPLNPPWALAFVAPLAVTKSYALAWLGWFVVMAAAIGAGSWMLMELYFREARIPDISDTIAYRCLFAFTFFPTLLCLEFGQIAPFVFLGVVGFLYFEHRSRPALAGIFLSLTLVKPQLVYLVWLSLLFRTIQLRRWRPLVCAIMSFLAMSGVAVAFDHRIFFEYWDLARGPYPHLYASGVLAVLRKALVRYDTFWLQFLPLAAGLLWWAAMWKKKRATWNWVDRMPVLVTASLLTSAWGFLFDQTLLAIPVIALAGSAAMRTGKLPLNLVAIYTALNVGLIVLVLTFPFWSFLPAPILIAFLLTRSVNERNTSSCQAEATECPQ